ncbi:MAG: hypothetical protein SAJ12_20085 [Jaaginema sp. PMC 1079.18]|nr:hypothetical protein [Jaaginema sp. PMC 1080.18]MEC4853287.1 hypothetical protein [Jaaginema sp. PMC 1079.18]MEC4868513.1 hypothetical protein [Jaaginema sp. PMC 1078.18]
MNVTRYSPPTNEAFLPFTGTWNIYDMEMWSEDYFNMEVQAYITVEDTGNGEFQFGLVCGGLSGYVETIGEVERFAFTWEGGDEMDEASGSGWLRIVDATEVEGLFDLHYGDRSLFKAKKRQ